MQEDNSFDPNAGRLESPDILVHNPEVLWVDYNSLRRLGIGDQTILQDLNQIQDVELKRFLYHRMNFIAVAESPDGRLFFYKIQFLNPPARESFTSIQLNGLNEQQTVALLRRHKELLEQRSDLIDRLAGARIEQEPRDIGFGRRLLLSGAAGAAGAWAYFKIRDTLLGESTNLTSHDVQAKPPASPPAPVVPKRPEAKEKLSSLPGIEAILAASLWKKDPTRASQKDNLLSPFQVSRHFLGGKFWYTGRSPEHDSGRQRIHRFAVIGRRSRFYDYGGEGKHRFNSTTLADSINDLLDYERLSDDEIKKWIIWTYALSFNVTNIITERLTIERDQGSRKITNVTYNPQSGFPDEILLSIPTEIPGVEPGSAQGHLTTKQNYFPILGRENRLLLQSGCSPDHDLYVPSDFLNHDKKFTLPLGKRPTGSIAGEYGEWELGANDLAEDIHWYEKIAKENGHKTVTTTHNGTNYKFPSCAAYVRVNHERTKKLAEFITREAHSDYERIMAITRFVQGLDYIGENDEDYNRTALLTLFNEGSDCNNKVVVWCSLMAALELKHGILFLEPTTHPFSRHVAGAIPNEYLPPPPDPIATGFRGMTYLELTHEFDTGIKPFNEPIIAAEVLEKIGNNWQSSTAN